jgi:tetratricopeptide (TPR) repeat protein
VLLLAQSVTVAQIPQVLLIDNFETDKLWESQASEGCTVEVLVDRQNAIEGQASLTLKAELTGGCGERGCFAGINLDTPDLRGYEFLRFWMKAELQEKALVGILLGLTGGKSVFHAIPMNRSGWHLVTVHFSEFEAEGEPVTVLSEEVEIISLFVVANEPVTVIVNFDNFVALTDTNDNKIPDVDEAEKKEDAKNYEEMANRHFEDEEYEKARKYYEDARSLYQQAGDQEKAQKMDSKAKESMVYHDVKMAEDLYTKGQYDEAMRAYEKARRGFVSLGDFDMVAQIEDKLQELSELTGKPVPPVPPSGQPPGQSNRAPRQRQGGARGLLLVLFIVILVGVGIYFLKFRGKAPTETKPDTKPKEKKLLPSEAKAEDVRNLKAKFVYGEISRKEYEKKLRELEE